MVGSMVGPGHRRVKTLLASASLVIALITVAGVATAAPPTATVTQTSTPPPEESITATCHASDPDGTATSCVWAVQGRDATTGALVVDYLSFGDSVHIPYHLWSSVQLCFTTTLTVSDADGESTVYDDPVTGLPTCVPGSAGPELTLPADTWKLPAHPFALRATLTGISAPATLTIDWGDGTSETHAVTAGELAYEHTYRGAGTWTIQACADAGGTTSCDTMALEQRGAEEKLSADKHPGKGNANGLS